MAYKLGKRSKSNLVGVHPDLVRVVERAILITETDFVVIEGVRTLERQQQLLASGASHTLKSRHLTGHAVDLAALLEGKVTWRSAPYHLLSTWVKQAATEVGVEVEWGGSWMTLVDLPHWQLPWDKYPV